MDGWQTSIQHLLKSGLSHAAVIDLQGNLQAVSDGFALQAYEGENLVAQFHNPRLLSNGIHINGTSYTFTIAKQHTIYGQHQNQVYCACTAVEGVILIAISDEPWSPPALLASPTKRHTPPTSLLTDPTYRLNI